MKQAIVFLMVVTGVAGFSTVGWAQPRAAANASVVKEFMTASGGSGMLYQYQTRYDIRVRAKDSVFVDTMSTEISDSRCTHVDMNMLGMKMTVLGRAGQRGYSILLYSGARKYKLNVIDTAKINGSGQSYQVTKIGTETVAGYPCIHSKLTIIGPNKRTIINEDIWTSQAVPGYAQLRQEMSNAQVTLKMMQELEKAGCNGFVVKMSGGSDQVTFQMTLITAERKNFPASVFVIPPGYTEM